MDDKFGGEREVRIGERLIVEVKNYSSECCRYLLAIHCSQRDISILVAENMNEKMLEIAVMIVMWIVDAVVKRVMSKSWSVCVEHKSFECIANTKARDDFL